MKKIYTVLVVFIFAVSISFSQILPGGLESKKSNSKKLDNHFKGSYYAGFAAKGINILDTWGLDIGVNFGGYLSDNFSIGGGFYYLMTSNLQVKKDLPYFLQFTYGGLEPQFLFSFDRFSINTKLMLGFGFAGYGQNRNFEVLSDLDGDWVYIAEPSVGVNVMFSDDFWIGLEAGYRLIADVDYEMVKNTDVSGPIISLTLKTIIRR